MTDFKPSFQFNAELKFLNDYIVLVSESPSYSKAICHFSNYQNKDFFYQIGVRLIEGITVILKRSQEGQKRSASEKWVSLTEASQVLQVSVSTIRRLSDKNLFKVKRTPGRQRRIDLKSLNEYKNKNELM